MNLAATPLHQLFAAKITGIDLSKPIDEGVQRAIERTMDEYAVCVLPNQSLEDEDQIAFSRLYGPLEVSPLVQDKSGRAVVNTRVRHREIFDISNLDQDEKILDENDARSAYRLGNQLWHTDSSFRQKSATWSMLHARIIPPAGGDTEFADTRAAYDALPDAMKRSLEGRRAVFDFRGRKRALTPTQDEIERNPPVLHPLVRTHPHTARKCLYVMRDDCTGIEGLDAEEAGSLICALADHIAKPAFIYRHQWRVGDLLLWDNCTVQHRAIQDYGLPQRRLMHRTTMGGAVPA